MSASDWQKAVLLVLLGVIAGMQFMAITRGSCEPEPVRGLTQEEMDYVPSEKDTRRMQCESCTVMDDDAPLDYVPGEALKP